MNLKQQFLQLKAAFAHNSYPDASERQLILKKMIHALKDYQEKLEDAVMADFGHRAYEETSFLELFPTIKAISYCYKNLNKWMKKRRRSVSWLFWPAKSYLYPQPLGVVGNMVPWNYPVYLSLVPTAYAIAAGNRVMVKVSELTPHTGAVLDEMIKVHELSSWIHICNGDVGVSKEFASLPFGHLIFTGSTATGRHIMKAASENLTPVTLELGGKSPAIIDKDVNKAYLKRVFMGKSFNAAQTCIAPDYLMIPKDSESLLISTFETLAQEIYPNYPNNAQYSGIISDNHYQRLKNLIQDAMDKGAKVVVLGNNLDNEKRILPLHLVFNVHDDMLLMQEEIFGPVLPVKTYESIDECISYINEHPHPLALYYFGHDKTHIHQLKTKTCSGALTINDTIMHIAIDALPFGGVGESGMGVYHGQEGFDTFSKLKPVFIQRRLAGVTFFYPPYGKLLSLFLKLKGGLNIRNKD